MRLGTNCNVILDVLQGANLHSYISETEYTNLCNYMFLNQQFSVRVVL